MVDIIEENLHTPDGVRFVSAVEDELYFNGSIKEPWVGFLHQVPYQSLRFPDLSRLIRSAPWYESIEYCLGLWVLSEHNRQYLLQNDIGVPVAKVFYPTPSARQNFSYAQFLKNKNKKLLFIGEFLRQYQPFFDITAHNYEKILFDHQFLQTHLRDQFVKVNETVNIVERVSDQEYDKLLSNNVVFLNLQDAGANTTIIECISSGTPVLVNKVGGVSEYLGENYPFYYSDLAEAELKLNDLDLIRKTSGYLKQLKTRDNLSASEFLAALQNTSVYRELPVPPSQNAQFKSYDVSLIMCAYKRMYNLEKQLTLLCEQEFDGTFEVIIWNNNRKNINQIDKICRPFEKKLALKIIHSSENFYCIIRMAVAGLARSDLLLICDDDVLPQKRYITTFLEKFEEYGVNCVLCARGHVFSPYELDEDRPESFWENAGAMKFFDESDADRDVHFMHADNALIPKEIMKKILQVEMPRYEFALVDDYWFSFVLQHYLGIPIRKIKADHAIKFTKCADDPDIAMFHNSLVNEQRINFYIYHMRKGWPPFQSNHF